MSISRRQFLQRSGGVAIASLMGKRVFGLTKDTKIVTAKIHPGIGIARVGNSPKDDGYFIGPEVLEPNPTREGFSRDGGALKRQAARFRIYGYNAAGEVVSELTSQNASITWTVHLANKKAQWYQFAAALDIPQSKDLSCPRRNPLVVGQDRKNLAIDPKARTITGKNSKGDDTYRFDGASIFGERVSLGELRTDENGRLLVLGGMGRSASPEGLPILKYKPDGSIDAGSFNNADGWFDDTSDGPVDATVVIDGEEKPVESAWVVVAPPNYAPDVIGWRTLYDLLVDTYVNAKPPLLKAPTTTSFTDDILPLLYRLGNLQWVNKGFADQYGYGGKTSLCDPKVLAELADKTHSDLRKQIYGEFRLPGTHDADQWGWPMLYGDSFGEVEDASSNHFTVPDLSAAHLKNWVNGNFQSDYEPNLPKKRSIEQVVIEKQPAMLDRAALHFCLADAFHPGCEMTWPMRNASLYRAPFRIKRRMDALDPDYGPSLTGEIALKQGGPLYEQGPGDLTRWMALPWQGDTAFCRSGYEPNFNPYLPTFWPARVPNHVLSEESYKVITSTDKAITDEMRKDAFQNRESWVRNLSGTADNQMVQMVNGFASMGVIEMREGPKNNPDIPPILFVESLPDVAPGEGAPKVFGAPKTVNEPVSEKTKEAGWQSDALLKLLQDVKGIRPRR